ncbi:MAG: THUMP-like domain-containing protein [Pseudomonadales bacterium]
MSMLVDPADQRFDPAQRAFVQAHREADPNALALKRAPPGIDLKLALEQVRAWQKLRQKAPTWAALPDLVLPGPISIEQASSPFAAAYKASLITQDTVIDLCGGLGLDTLAFAARRTALADGAQPADAPRRVTRHVERDPMISRCFAWNAPRLGFPEVEVCNLTAEQAVDELPTGCTVYLDPARRAPNATAVAGLGAARVAAFADSSPDVTALLPIFRARDATVLIKASPMLDLVAGAMALGAVTAIHVVSVDNVCREVLFLLQSGVVAPALDDIPITCAVFDRVGGLTRWVGSRAVESAALPDFGPPGRYLLDADVAIRKAGLFRHLATGLGLRKLAPNTHLYSADQKPESFPGRVFEVEKDGVTDPRRLLPEGRAQVISRNHPLGAEALRARYKLREGDEHALIGYRDHGNRPRLAVARRIS